MSWSPHGSSSPNSPASAKGPRMKRKGSIEGDGQASCAAPLPLLAETLIEDLPQSR